MAGFANVDHSLVAIALDDAEVRGGTVEFDALANNTRVFFDEDTLGLGDFAIEILGGIVESTSLIGGVSVSRADAFITISQSSSVVAENFDANAAALGNGTAAPIGLEIGVAVGIVETNAQRTVAGAITTTGKTTLQSRVDNTADIRGDASALVEAGIGVAVSVVNSNSTVDVKDSAHLIVGGDLAIQADTFDCNYTATRFTSGGDGSIGIMVAVFVEHGDTFAFLDGTADVTDNIIINALQEKAPILGTKIPVIGGVWFSGVHAMAGVNTDSTGNIIGEGQSTLIDVFIGSKLKAKVIHPVTDFIKAKMGKTGFGEQLSFDIGAGVAVVVDTNTVEARIGDGLNRPDLNGDDRADVEADGSISIHARVRNVPDLTAKSQIKALPTTAGKREGNPTESKFAGSLAVAFGEYHNNTKAYINTSAKVDAGAALNVKAETLNNYAEGLAAQFNQPVVPDYASKDGHDGDVVKVSDGHTAGGAEGSLYRYRAIDGVLVNLGTENYADLNRWELIGNATLYAVKAAASFLTTFLDNQFGVDKVFTSWSQATAAGDKVAVAGAVTVLILDHQAEAYIAENARINQDTAVQHVAVQALSVNQSVHFGGNVNLPSLGISQSRRTLDVTKPGGGTTAGEDAVGFSALVLLYEDDVTAELHDGVQINVDSLLVDASNDSMSVMIAASGGKSSGLAFNGVFSYTEIDDGAQVTVGSAHIIEKDNTDTGKSLIIKAADNVVTRDTRAVIGNFKDEDTDSATGSLSVGGSAIVEARNDGFIGAFCWLRQWPRTTASRRMYRRMTPWTVCRCRFY